MNGKTPSTNIQAPGNTQAPSAKGELRLRRLLPLPAEWRELQYRHHERLGHLAGAGLTTVAEEAAARAEAEACLEAWEASDLEPVIGELKISAGPDVWTAGSETTNNKTTEAS